MERANSATFCFYLEYKKKLKEKKGKNHESKVKLLDTKTILIIRVKELWGDVWKRRG